MAKRDRAEERNLSLDYLEEVNQAFSHFFLQYDDTPLLVINTTDIDFVADPVDFDDLIAQIESMDAGRQVYVPRRSR